MRGVFAYFYFTMFIALSAVVLLLLTAGYFLLINTGYYEYQQAIKHEYDWGRTQAYLWPSKEGGMLYEFRLRFDVYDEYEPRINALTVTNIRMIIHLKDTVYWERGGSILLDQGERYYGYAGNIFTFITPYHLKVDRLKLPYEPLRMIVECTFISETGTSEKQFKYFFKTKGLNNNDLQMLGLDGCIPK